LTRRRDQPAASVIDSLDNRRLIDDGQVSPKLGVSVVNPWTQAD